MGEDSKKRQELKKQIEKRISGGANITIVEKVASLLCSPKKWQIVESIATPLTDEAQKFIICFDYLNWSECFFDQFNSAKGKKLVHILSKVAKCEVNKLSELKLSRDSVEAKGEYASLFSSLSEDVQRLEETELCDGRMFYFITIPYFNVVSIETKHRNTSR